MRFQLDKFQEEAISAVNKEESILVSAPTGAGKTLIAEHVIKKCIIESKGVIYTAPIKALSNQKYREFQLLFPGLVGIITGDVNINPNAPLLIMTTEIFRNRILENSESMSQYSWIIFDEIHYLDNHERGTVWEESLIFLPSHMRIVGLSATIPNIDQLAAWLSEIHHHPIRTIIEHNRPVPLQFHFQCNGKVFNSLHVLKKVIYYSKQMRHPQQYDTESWQASLKKNDPLKLIKHLEQVGRLPAIYFSFSRKRCEYLAQRCHFFDLLNPEEKETAISLFEKLTVKYGIANDQRTMEVGTMIERGIAYHHAGLHPMLKETIEQLFTHKLIYLIFTTETFALGINMPARTVILDELRKRYGRFHKTITIRDFFQMAGRSGRRGIDTVGYVYSRINPLEIPFEEIKLLFQRPPEPVRSRFNASYACILNLYHLYKENLFQIYQQSFDYFLFKNKKNQSQLQQMKTRLNILKKMDYINNGILSPKAHFARNIYGYELIMAELFDSGFLEQLNYKQLAMLCLAAVFEPRSFKPFKDKFTPEIRRLKKITDPIFKTINDLEKQNRIYPLSKKFYFDLSDALDHWMHSHNFAEILSEYDSDEGEIIRFFRMCIQVLREILDTPISKSLKQKINHALDLINRGDINAEDQLKMMTEDEINIGDTLGVDIETTDNNQ
jgi:superfamily II RNA helicase